MVTILSLTHYNWSQFYNKNFMICMAIIDCVDIFVPVTKRTFLLA